MAAELQEKQAEQIAEAFADGTESLTTEEKVDRYGALQAEVAALGEKAEKRVQAIYGTIAEKQTEMADLAKEIEAAVEAGVQKSTVVGRFFVATVGKPAMKRTIKNMKRVAELVGLDQFFELCTFPLGSVDDYLNPHQREEVLDVNHDGNRSFKVAPR